MARIRSIKPGFFASLPIADLPIPARLTFIGLWTYADDEGRGLDDPRLIKAAVWPLDDGYTAKKVDADMALLETKGRIRRYTVGEKRCFQVERWHEHQRVNRPQPSNIPAPDASSNGHGSDSEDARTDHGTITDRSSPEGKGKGVGTGKVVDGNASSSSGEPLQHGADSDDDRGASTPTIEAACELVGAERLNRRVCEKGPVGNPDAWAAEAGRRAYLEVCDAYAVLGDQASADELASWVLVREPVSQRREANA